MSHYSNWSWKLGSPSKSVNFAVDGTADTFAPETSVIGFVVGAGAGGVALPTFAATSAFGIEEFTLFTNKFSLGVIVLLPTTT